MGLIKITSPETPSADDQMSAVKRVNLKALNKSKILKRTEVEILPFKNMKLAGISSIEFTPIAELCSSVSQDQPMLSSGDILWAAGWVIKA